MEKFTGDINGVYQLINEGKANKNIINVTVLSKQYLAYYLYRIMTKFMPMIEIGLPLKDIKNILQLLRVPKEHNRILNYPLAGKMTNDEELLNLIILSIIDIFIKFDKYIQSLPSQKGFSIVYEFIKSKELSIIIKDLIDLQKLVPGLSVSAIRPNYIDDEDLK
jgi:hypothetical protein